MASRVKTAGVALLVAAACSAQAKPLNSNGELAQEMYRQARVALASAPDALAPRLLLDMASGELRLFPEHAADDFAASFVAARGLDDSSELDAAQQALRVQVKTQTEAAAVGALARAGKSQRALELVRTADIARGPLYDLLLIAAAQPPPPDPDAAKSGADKPAPPPQKLADLVFGMVQECKHADNTYPYRGVAAVVRGQQLDAYDRMQLIRDGYRWAGNATTGSQIAQAPVFLQAAHARAPELDGELEAVLVTLLTRLGQGDDLGAGAGAAGGHLMALLGQLDPARANALAATYPNVGTQTAMPGGENEAITLPPLQYTGGADLAAPAPNPQQPAGGPEFVGLIAQAEALLRKDPSAALSAANHAAGLLDEGLWTREGPTAAELATLFQRLGSVDEAARIMSRCLDVADQEARDTDIEFHSAPADARAQIEQTLETTKAEPLVIYGMAARLDPQTAAVRAQALGSSLMQPLILMRVAEIAMSNNP